MYSYHTCGNLDTYASSSQMLAGKKLRYWTLHNLTLSETVVIPDPGSRQFTWAYQFVAKVLDSLGMDLDDMIYYDISPAAKNASASYNSWTQCILDVSLGNLDLCFNAYETLQRRAVFSHPTLMVTDEMFLVGIEKEDTAFDLLPTLWAPFRPFDPLLWLLIMGVSLSTGLALQFFAANRPAGVMINIRRGLYTGILSFLSGGSMAQPDTTSGSIMHLGFSFFLLVTIASFTANTASFLITKQQAAFRVNGLETIASRGIPVCIPNAVQMEIFAQFPRLNSERNTVKATPIECMDMLLDGEIDYSIVSLSTYLGKQAEGEACKVQKLGNSVVLPAISMWSRADLASMLGYATSALSKSGWAQNHFSRSYASQCPADGAEKAESVDSVLKPEHMLGNTIFCAMCFVVALFVHKTQCVVARAHDEGSKIAAVAHEESIKIAAVAHEETIKFAIRAHDEASKIAERVAELVLDHVASLSHHAHREELESAGPEADRRCTEGPIAEV